MPRLSRVYRQCLFRAEVVQEAILLVEQLNAKKIEDLEPDAAKNVNKYDWDYRSNSFTKGTDTWYHDSFDEFFADYRNGFDTVTIIRSLYFFKIEFRSSADEFVKAVVEIYAPTRAEVVRIFDVFDRQVGVSSVPEKKRTITPPIIFIGHGGNKQWRDLKDHLQDKHHYDVQAYEVGARAGHTIRDILDDMLSKSSFAVLVMTAEDETAEGTFNPRLNVVHELGLFQGRIGFSRAIVLLEGGAEEFSNIHGIQQIRFSKGNIKETFGDVVATLKREFG